MARKVRPIRPSEVVRKKRDDFPDIVFEAFNELIAQKLSGRIATIEQAEVVALMVAKGLREGDIFDKGWLDIEDVYYDAGWQVEFDKPGYNESYPATFTFRVR